MTIVFENTDTMRFQIQEMARVERMLTDEAIAHEIDTYNELIPERGRALGHAVHRAHRRRDLREWLPKLVGIEHHVVFTSSATGTRVEAVRDDEERLTRDDITATVHYLKFPFTAGSRLRSLDGHGPAAIVVDHPEYQAGVELTDDAARRARRRLRGLTLDCAHPASSGSTPTCRSRASSTPTTPGYDLYAREEAVLAAGGGRALVPTGHRDRDPGGLRRLRAAALGARAAARRHVPQHARAHRRAATAASSRCCS